jgi:hypothetical protein
MSRTAVPVRRGDERRPTDGRHTTKGIDPMRYMLLIYNDEKLAEQQREAMPEAEQER